MKFLRLLENPKKTILVINKTEGKINEATLNECSNLGFGSPVKISTAHMQGIDNLKYLISKVLPSDESDTLVEEGKKLSIAIVGKTNSGKSTLLNSLKGENLSITGDLPNLTRDAIETTIKNNFLNQRLLTQLVLVNLKMIITIFFNYLQNKQRRKYDYHGLL